MFNVKQKIAFIDQDTKDKIKCWEAKLPIARIICICEDFVFYSI